MHNLPAPLRSLLYLGYYLKTLDRPTFRRFFAHYAERHNIGSLSLYLRIARDVLRYRISPLEYFQFDFLPKRHAEKRTWAGTGTMYEYQRVMNPPSARAILEDKTLFSRAYAPFIRHRSYDLPTLRAQPGLAADLLASYRLVLKTSHGQCGRGTAFLHTEGHTPHSLIAHMTREGYDLAETYVAQHPDLHRLSPSGLNTVRIVTQLDAAGQVQILTCRQRISVNSPVDNLAAGNLAAPIDPDTGRISGPAVYSDITRPEAVTEHPATGVTIPGFQVPHWPACLELARQAALAHPQNRSIGWDLAVTEEGPGLIEGNHDWCKLVWQLPVGKGLKSELDAHLSPKSGTRFPSIRTRHPRNVGIVAEHPHRSHVPHS